ncbi:hypothetical protein M409DRAFT_71348 [Zasmidium cellare ATCC 36951]|uniref:Uncharacterized protein n=1 Tax=Zasmidium cellare ATCC 36951 TaxID=1080233 RepID=A0A6A6BZY8_ZASCE|nr:uncharacterized protein M409DRAFT_71348 [Zasmidium cellare ATCC 36951]KAF2159006.1 hypothetical protein M409DRAFT_71348 [Zasmidium cellare ATCC 36951]
MRLLHLMTLELREFFNEDAPPYAILSHRWGKSEVSYKEMRKRPNLKDHPGMAKIEDFCGVNQLKPVGWGWIDTCCIDKSSSAELSEAIKSMFVWYRGSDFCCVHLADVSCASGTEQAFIESEWFTRGWTLQELIAPTTVLFCDASWRLLGHKCSHAPTSCQEHGQGKFLNAQISHATNIRIRYLQDPQAYTKASIACRMSWMSERKTTRVEDIAYCLLGIFDVHMPPLYGEGHHTFRRLQEEIIRNFDDQSIFACRNPGIRNRQISQDCPNARS